MYDFVHVKYDFVLNGVGATKRPLEKSDADESYPSTPSLLVASSFTPTTTSTALQSNPAPWGMRYRPVVPTDTRTRGRGQRTRSPREPAVMQLRLGAAPRTPAERTSQGTIPRE